MAAEKAMNAMKSARVGCRLSVVVVLTVLLLGVGAHSARSQNAAQKAALTKLNHTRLFAHAQDSISLEASNTSLDLPSGLAFDGAGDLFIADTDNHRILEVNLLGIVSTVAGTGEQGFGGDGGAATSALLDSPYGVAVDAAGNLYIADTHNQRIREVVAGTINTIAGTGVAGFGGDGAAATSATLDLPLAVAVDSKANVYIADTNNQRIREITGGNMQTVAGDGDQTFSGDGGLATAAGLDSPSGVAVDSAFNLYIGDTHNQRVRMVTFSTGIITTLAGTGVKGFTADGSASGAALARPLGVAVDGSGTVYVADSDNQRIRSISAGVVATVAGNGEEGYSGNNGVSTSASLDSPRAVAAQENSVAVADTQNQAVQVVSGGSINTTVGAPATVEALTLNGPTTNVYGTGTLVATFSNGSNKGTGTVTFYDGLGSSPALVGTQSLSSNTATLNTSLLGAGLHYIVASYAGDANNAPFVSGVYVLSITPVQLTATAKPVAIEYGQPIPQLTGTLTGVLAQDAGKVTATFSTQATLGSTPGTYPITVALSGSSAANYTVVLSTVGAGGDGSGSGSVAIGLAPSGTKVLASNLTPISGTSVALTATVSSGTSGTPTGTVSFYDGATLLNTTPAPLSGGVATLAVASLPVGTQSLTAVYSGDTDFLASTSAALAVSALSPEFSIASSTPAQIIRPSQAASYTIALTPTNPTFVYPVTLSASGLPSNVTATFSPSSIAVGSMATSTTLTLTSSAQARLEHRNRALKGTYPALALLLLPLAFFRRLRKTAGKLSRSGQVLIALLALTAATALSGCAGTGFFGQSQQSYTVTVTAVSGPNTHTTNITLTVQ